CERPASSKTRSRWRPCSTSSRAPSTGGRYPPSAGQAMSPSATAGSCPADARGRLRRRLRAPAPERARHLARNPASGGGGKGDRGRERAPRVDPKRGCNLAQGRAAPPDEQELPCCVEVGGGARDPLRPRPAQVRAAVEQLLERLEVTLLPRVRPRGNRAAVPAV